MRTLLTALGLLCLAGPVWSTAAPRLIVADVQVAAATRTLTVSTIVADDPQAVFHHRYRTILRYRCRAGWVVAVRTAATTPSTTIRWRYPRPLAHHTCSVRVTVTDGHTSDSHTVTRRL
jgi:hypothetical protein